MIEAEPAFFPQLLLDQGKTTIELRSSKAFLDVFSRTSQQEALPLEMSRPRVRLGNKGC